ncbi:hypothetical protein FXB42_09515 [Acetobacterium wieringae]|uniref:TnsA endonuclease N-terminal domain-containing protein n=1 Tax=Acetobacterium wieringae TaxID=52694 RepID=A0A5D0WNQ1_9FIRM|nr:TnsA endonuclease N-terminal domain-containing protein [Acetobacterium wieringae]TYC85398.1 hypothetical protein FXB42_09515 [Acetobacterium wieringae]
MLNKNPVNIARSKHYGSNYYVSHSKKLNRRVDFHSNLEYGNYLSVELNPNITTYLEQPVKGEILDENGKLCKTIFDMEVEYKNGVKELWEIKYSSELTGTDIASVRSQKQIEIQKKWCELNGINYRLRNEKDIFKGSEHLNNMRFMYHCLNRADIDLIYSNKNRLADIIEHAGCITIGELFKSYKDPDSVYPTITYFLINECIAADIYNQEISFETEVYHVAKKN